VCGFLCWWGFNREIPSNLTENGRLLEHRGPDDAGDWKHPALPLAFVHRRLSIIDIEQGGQPMVRGKNAIAYNGEIYNFRQIKKELKKEGMKFHTNSDTEVILQGYRQHGEDILDRLRGMFSLVIWDEKKKQLLLARDHAGQKPLYYYRDKEFFIAGSELQALLARPEISNRLNKEILPDYLRLGYIPTPDSGISGIKKLPPGHRMILRPEKEADILSYWSLADKSTTKTINNPGNALRKTLKQAVKRRLVSDVPVGAFLSGGIDSSIIVGLMQQLMVRPVQTVTVGFSDDRYDERDYARLVADFHGTDHHEYQANIKLKELLPRLVHHFGEPFADPSAVPTYYVASQARRAVKVALAGDGGDELFGGYRRYRAMQILAKIRRWLPAPVRKLIQRGFKRLGIPANRRSKPGELLRVFQHLGESEAGQYLAMVGLGGENIVNKICCNELKEHWFNTWEILPFKKEIFAQPGEAAEKVMLIDLLTYLPGDLLVKTDITTMMNSLECRCPYLDRDLIELSRRISINQKIKGRQGKVCLRQAFADLLPEQIQNRGKMGFGVPLARWFREGEKSNYLAEILMNSHDGFFSLIDREELEKALTAHINEEIDIAPLLWALVMFKLWLEEMNIKI